jgi:hypothetical protein
MRQKKEERAILALDSFEMLNNWNCKESGASDS